MCKASIHAAVVVPALVGTTYGIGFSNHGLGALHPAELSTAECVACVEHSARLEFSNIPEDLRERFDIGDTDIATLLIEKDDYHDVVIFSNGMETFLCELADYGVTACVLELLTADDGGTQVSVSDEGVGGTLGQDGREGYVDSIEDDEPYTDDALVQELEPA